MNLFTTGQWAMMNLVARAAALYVEIRSTIKTICVRIKSSLLNLLHQQAGHCLRIKAFWRIRALDIRKNCLWKYCLKVSQMGAV